MGELAIDFGIINADNVEQVRQHRYLLSYLMNNFIPFSQFHSCGTITYNTCHCVSHDIDRSI